MPATSSLLCAGLRSSQCTLSIVHAKAMCMRYSSNSWIMPASSASVCCQNVSSPSKLVSNTLN